jgi:peptide/nickel transport system ATP-binding protein
VGLIGAMPVLGTSLAQDDWRLAEIPGSVPSTMKKATGCVFADRCSRVADVCRRVRPGLRGHSSTHTYACHFPVEGEARNG